ncbi:MAG: cytochrome c maturation protein CcmE [Ignavibacteriales bacterium]|nr:cytochrome c maturation protein CcmE [Ignavibacteriales bacterium]
MNVKVVVGGLIIVFGIVLGVVNFFDSNVEYGDFALAKKTQKKIQVKGEWVKDRESSFDAQKIQYTFFLKDDSGEILKVVLDGAKPNNFDLATSVVIKGKYVDNYFHATEVLTKCPSKYEGKIGVMKKQS